MRQHPHWRLCACVYALVLGAADTVHARDYFVNPSGANGAFPTVQSAVDAVEGQTEIDRANIFIAPAKYVERVSVDKPFVTFIGQGETPAGVIISFNGIPTQTPVKTLGESVSIQPGATTFMARNLTFENTTPASSSLMGLALRCDADRTIFDNVRCLGYQDTLFVNGMARQYFRGNFIRGDVDFIFGNATAVFDRCTIESANRGYITAASTARVTANGFVFLDCFLVSSGAANNSVFLGRPWLHLPSQQMPSVIFIRTWMHTHINRAGWEPWEYFLPLSVNRDPYTRFSEWGSANFAGQLLADANHDGTPDGRVPWADPMSASQAANYTLKNIFGPVEFWNETTQPETSTSAYVSQGDPWNPDTQLLSLPAKPGAKPQLLNISTRLVIGAGHPVGIGGFIITGSEAKKVILRVIGPSLGNAGLAEVMADPVLEVHGGSADSLIATNDNWRDDGADGAIGAELAAAGLAPLDDNEAATVVTLSPGQYTAVLRGKDGSAGVALIEMYDGDLVADSQLANISTLGFAGTGDDVLIGGFVVGGPGSAKVVVRAIGPSLTSFGVQNAIADPTLAVHDSNGNVTSNDDWQMAPNSESIPVSLLPSDPRESVIQMTLTPGSYTAIVRGKGNTTGVALVEAYNLQ